MGKQEDQVGFSFYWWYSFPSLSLAPHLWHLCYYLLHLFFQIFTHFWKHTSIQNGNFKSSPSTETQCYLPYVEGGHKSNASQCDTFQFDAVAAYSLYSRGWWHHSGCVNYWLVPRRRLSLAESEGLKTNNFVSVCLCALWCHLTSKITLWPPLGLCPLRALLVWWHRMEGGGRAPWSQHNLQISLPSSKYYNLHLKKTMSSEVASNGRKIA